MSLRQQWDALLRAQIRTTHAAPMGVYGVCKILHEHRFDRETLARPTIERLMGAEGPQWIVREAQVCTTLLADDVGARAAAGIVQRQVTAARPYKL